MRPIHVQPLARAARVASAKLEGATLGFPENIEGGGRIATEQSDPVLRAAEEEEERREGRR
ncbi:MAG TPA: hypothetical protein VJ600_04605 [Holophagaceae bacterium]|nr:hypothetical protein [Holophagaceae bacterium]